MQKQVEWEYAFKDSVWVFYEHLLRDDGDTTT